MGKFNQSKLSALRPAADLRRYDSKAGDPTAGMGDSGSLVTFSTRAEAVLMTLAGLGLAAGRVKQENQWEIC